MPALCLILNSAYYANNYAGIFDAGLMLFLKGNLYNTRIEDKPKIILKGLAKMYAKVS